MSCFILFQEYGFDNTVLCTYSVTYFTTEQKLKYRVHVFFTSILILVFVEENGSKCSYQYISTHSIKYFSVCFRFNFSSPGQLQKDLNTVEESLKQLNELSEAISGNRTTPR